MKQINSTVKKSYRVISFIAALFLVIAMLAPIITSCSTSDADITTTTTESTVATTAPVEDATEPEVAEPALIETPITFNDVQYIELYSIPESNKKIEELDSYLQQLDTAIESELYDFPATYTMQLERSRIGLIKQQYEMNIEALNTWQTEHYYAYKTLEFFMQNGYSKEAACGIIGNMMVETSGGSLDLKPMVYSSGKYHYGLCQWYLKYKPFMANMTFEMQIEYLLSDIPVEFETFGFCYKKHFTAEDFMIMTDAGEAAEAFAKVYERPGSGTYTLRSKCAVKAFEYFTLPPQICY